MIDNDSFDSLISYMEINIKGCSDIVHDKSWFESGGKVDYDLWVVLDGEVKMTFGDKEHILKPNDVFLLYPQSVYKASSQSETCRFIYIHFDAKIGNNSRALDGFPFAGNVPAEEICNEVALFINSYEEYRNRVPVSNLFLKGYFIVLLAKIIKYKYENKETDYMPALKKQSITRLYPALTYISNNINKPVCIKELAATVGMSEKYFITFFKDIVGITPANYVLQVKMKRSLEYLYERKYSVKEVAMLIGYEDQYTFSKAFKNIYKIAPSKVV